MFQKKLDEFIQMLLQSNNELDEWYLSDFLDKYISNMKAYEAFSSLKETIPYLFKYPQYRYELLEIMSMLKRLADTTEPFCEKNILESLLKLYQNDGYSVDLIRQIFE